MVFVRKSVREAQKRKTSEQTTEQNKKAFTYRKPSEHKYIVYTAKPEMKPYNGETHIDASQERILIFSADEIHRDMASRLAYRNRVISAGFVRISEHEIVCYGESESLGIKSRGEADTILVHTNF